MNETTTNPLIRAHSVTRALNIVGDRWSLLIIYALFLGVRRFNDLLQMTGMSRSILANRLKRLREAGVLKPSTDQGGYHLSEMGRDLYDVALALIAWDRSWHYDPLCPTHHVMHQGCGKVFTPKLICEHCLEPVHPRDSFAIDGPGSGMDPHPGHRVLRRSSVPIASLALSHPIMERSLEILGDRWSAMVIAAAFYRIHHFNEFQSVLGIASNILSDRLIRLTELGVFSRAAERSRPDYRLTAQGLDLFPIIVTLMRWGDRWLAAEKGPPVLLFHRSCGAQLEPVMVCDQCDERLHFGDFSLADALPPAPSA